MWTHGDYRNRYAWIRDASFTLDALWIGICPDEADDFVSWMAEAAGGHVHEDRPLQIMYGVAGERDLAERWSRLAAPSFISPPGCSPRSPDLPGRDDRDA